MTNPGRGPIYLVTSVMSQEALSDAQMAVVYGKRWGIEVYYRHCKQTFERRKLRSQNPDNAMVELHWSLLGMWAMGLHSHARLVGGGVLPQQISFAGIWRAYRRPMREFKSRPYPGERMGQLIDRAVIDPYRRKNKAGRDYPRKKQEQATVCCSFAQRACAEVQQAMKVKREQKKGLTA